MTKERTRPARKCPECGGMSVLRIVYGMPGPALITDADAGRVILGGCCIEPGQPNRQCTACGWNDGTHGRDDD